MDFQLTNFFGEFYMIFFLSVTSRLQRVTKVPMDQSNVRSTNRASRQKRKELTIDPDLPTNFSTEKLNQVLLAFTRNSFKILAKGTKNGSSPFLTIF
jgi:hypothetical protein